MKKRRLLGLCAVFPLALLCSCSMIPELAFSANWHNNINNSAPQQNTLETLTYEVTATPTSTIGNLSVEYGVGTYTTKLEYTTWTENEKEIRGYVYSTELNISGSYTVNGQKSETFQDFTRSSVKFCAANDLLRPVESVKEVKCTYALDAIAPEGATASIGKAEDFLQVAHTKYTVNYSPDLLTASTVLKDMSVENGEQLEKNYEELNDEGTFLDNEQILFALRGVSTSAPWTFYTLNQQQNKVSEVGVSTQEMTEKFTFAIGEEEAVEREITAYTASISYNETLSGLAQTATFAKTTSSTNNTYRNVMLKMSVPTMYNLTTMTYTLKQANFIANA